MSKSSNKQYKQTGIKQASAISQQYIIDPNFSYQTTGTKYNNLLKNLTLILLCGSAKEHRTSPKLKVFNIDFKYMLPIIHLSVFKRRKNPCDYHK